jgi:hypothetical protein
MKIDLVIQGGTNSYTEEIVAHYQKLPWVHRIIVSTWNKSYLPVSADEVIVSLPLSNNGIGNRNAQITTSYAGLREVTTDFAAKLRSDQKISLDSMNVLYERMLTNQDKILTLGSYKPFPFHPRDHSFWGRTKNLIDLFDIPHDHDSHEVSNPHDTWPYPGFYAHHTRAECYIASQYLAKKDHRVKRIVEAPVQYLHDFAPCWEYSKEVSDELMPKYFLPAPKIDFEWPKHGMSAYNYDWAASHYGETWANS